MKLLMTGLVAAAALSCVFQTHPAKAGPPLTVAVTSCPGAHLVGFSGTFPGGAGGPMRQFLGVPYAKPPTGANRWQPPMTSCWSGDRQALTFSKICPQGVPPHGSYMDEDCLYLNVFTPATGNVTKLPVMVFIHGGALTSGSSSYFGQNPVNLVNANTVVVTISYRLGALGFLAHSALDKVSTQNTGNYGILDQIAALKWIKANIANFGGNPKNVTIFGQSAGGLSVMVHLVSPLSKGLFAKAIIESGALYNAPTLLSFAEGTGSTFAINTNCAKSTASATAKCLRALPVDTVLGAQGVLGGSTRLLKQDNVVLTDSIQNLLMAGRVNKVPVINGSNHDEERQQMGGSNFGGIGTGDSCHFQSNLVPTSKANFAGAVTLSTALTNVGLPGTALSHYPQGATPLATNEAFGAAATDANFACRAWRTSNWLAAAGVKVFAYEFNDTKAPMFQFGPFTLHDHNTMPYGAYHGAETGYLFVLPAVVGCGLPNPGLTSAQTKLAADLVTYWTTFAKTGSPNPISGTIPPAWPVYKASNGMMLSMVAATPKTLKASDFDKSHQCTSFWNSAAP